MLEIFARYEYRQGAICALGYVIAESVNKKPDVSFFFPLEMENMHHFCLDRNGCFSFLLVIMCFALKLFIASGYIYHLGAFS